MLETLERVNVFDSAGHSATTPAGRIAAKTQRAIFAATTLAVGSLRAGVRKGMRIT